MRTKKLMSIFVLVLIIAFAHISYNISLTNFKLSDANNSFLGNLTWSRSLDNGLQAAQQEDKPVMVYFWAVWCQFCKQFESETLKNPEVNSILREDYILVAMDLDIDREVARRYGVSFPPYTLFLDAGGNVLERIPGAVDAGYFLPRLVNVRDKMN